MSRFRNWFEQCHQISLSLSLSTNFAFLCWSHSQVIFPHMLQNWPHAPLNLGSSIYLRQFCQDKRETETETERQGKYFCHWFQQKYKKDVNWSSLGHVAILEPITIATVFFFLDLILFLLFWLCWVFFAASGLSLVMASGGYSSLRW